MFSSPRFSTTVSSGPEFVEVSKMQWDKSLKRIIPVCHISGVGVAPTSDLEQDVFLESSLCPFHLLALYSLDENVHSVSSNST